MSTDSSPATSTQSSSSVPVTSESSPATSTQSSSSVPVTSESSPATSTQSSFSVPVTSHKQSSPATPKQSSSSSPLDRSLLKLRTGLFSKRQYWNGHLHLHLLAVVQVQDCLPFHLHLLKWSWLHPSLFPALQKVVPAQIFFKRNYHQEQTKEKSQSHLKAGMKT